MHKSISKQLIKQVIDEIKMTRDLWLKHNKTEPERHEEAEKKNGVSSATLAGRLSPGILPTEGGLVVGGGGGKTAEETKEKKGPEGYRCWIAPALNTVKERK